MPSHDPQLRRVGEVGPPSDVQYLANRHSFPNEHEVLKFLDERKMIRWIRGTNTDGTVDNKE